MLFCICVGLNIQATFCNQQQSLLGHFVVKQKGKNKINWGIDMDTKLLNTDKPQSVMIRLSTKQYDTGNWKIVCCQCVNQMVVVILDDTDTKHFLLSIRLNLKTVCVCFKTAIKDCLLFINRQFHPKNPHYRSLRRSLQNLDNNIELHYLYCVYFFQNKNYQKLKTNIWWHSH